MLVEHTPPALRGQASALYLMAISVIGIGLGPTAVALCTEQLFADPAAVRWSIGLVGAAGSVLAAALLFRLGWAATHHQTPEATPKAAPKAVPAAPAT
jgi:MFS family permease